MATDTMQQTKQVEANDKDASDKNVAARGATLVLRSPSTIDAIRAFSVIYGPSALLDLFVAASAGVLVRQILGFGSACSMERRLRRFAPLGVGLAAAYLSVLRPRLRRWGATNDEQRARYRAMMLVPDPAIVSTWAVTIDAPAEDVWPWVAQIGQDRGGFYSYEWLENLAGCKLRNADRIHPEWQQRTVGEIVPLHLESGFPWPTSSRHGRWCWSGWGPFVVEPIDEHRTRLISRSRVPKGWGALAYSQLLEIPHFVMQRKMLLGIKERAERARLRASTSGSWDHTPRDSRPGPSFSRRHRGSPPLHQHA